MDLFYTPTELVYGKEGKKPEIGQRLRIGGMVVEGSVKRDPNSLKVSFDLHDVGPSITVTYDGICRSVPRRSGYRSTRGVSGADQN